MNLNWINYPLDKLVYVLNGFAFKSKKYTDNGIRVIRIANVQDGYIEDDKPVFYPLDAQEEIENYMLNNGDLLMSLTGNVGRVAIMSKDMLPAALNQRVACLRVKDSSIVNTKYLFYYFRQYSFQKQSVDNSKGTAQLNMSTEWLKKYEIKLPPLAEQHRIVERIESLFSQLDEARDKAQEALENIHTWKDAIYHSVFRGEYTSKRDLDSIKEQLSEIYDIRDSLIKQKVVKKAKVLPVSDTDTIQDYSTNWISVKLGEIAFVTKLAGFEYTKYIELTDKGDVPVVRAQNVRKGYLDLNNLLYIDSGTSELLERSSLHKPSILITFIGAGIGDVCVFDEKERFHLAPNVAKVEPFINDRNDLIEIRYILHYLLSHFGQAEIFKSMKATAQPSLSMETIRDIIIPIPHIDEQKTIVRVLDKVIDIESNMSSEIESVKRQIDAIKKSILAKAFRGELGTNDPEDESAIELLKRVIDDSQDK